MILSVSHSETFIWGAASDDDWKKCELELPERGGVLSLVEMNAVDTPGVFYLRNLTHHEPEMRRKTVLLHGIYDLTTIRRQVLDSLVRKGDLLTWEWYATSLTPVPYCYERPFCLSLRAVVENATRGSPLTPAIPLEPP